MADKTDARRPHPPRQHGDRGSGPRKIGADAWFDWPEAGRYDVQEQSISIGNEEVLTLIVIAEEAMLEEAETFSGRRC